MPQSLRYVGCWHKNWMNFNQLFAVNGANTSSREVQTLDFKTKSTTKYFFRLWCLVSSLRSLPQLYWQLFGILFLKLYPDRHDIKDMKTKYKLIVCYQVCYKSSRYKEPQCIVTCHTWLLCPLWSPRWPWEMPWWCRWGPWGWRLPIWATSTTALSSLSWALGLSPRIPPHPCTLQLPTSY